MPGCLAANPDCAHGGRMRSGKMSAKARSTQRASTAAVAALAAGVIVGFLVSSCAPPPNGPDGLGHSRLRGEVISRGRVQPVIQDVWQDGFSTVSGLSKDGLIFLRLGRDCEHGSTFSVKPAEAAEVVDKIQDPQGGYLAISLKPNSRTSASP